jgi:hypothetical protein
LVPVLVVFRTERVKKLTPASACLREIGIGRIEAESDIIEIAKHHAFHHAAGF